MAPDGPRWVGRPCVLIKIALLIHVYREVSDSRKSGAGLYGSTWLQMASEASRWVHMIPDGPGWHRGNVFSSKLHSCSLSKETSRIPENLVLDSRWLPTAQNESRCFQIIPDDFRWFEMARQYDLLKIALWSLTSRGRGFLKFYRQTPDGSRAFACRRFRIMFGFVKKLGCHCNVSLQ